jgi:Rieske Fe-S protein
VPTRRQILEMAAALAAAFASACRASRSARLPPGAIAVPLADLPDGVHVARLREAEPIDILRTGPTVVVRSRYCTHMGCVVAWDTESGGYKCPCHGGAYDAAGRPSAGPPTEALRLLPVELREDDVIILPRPPSKHPG